MFCDPSCLRENMEAVYIGVGVWNPNFNSELPLTIAIRGWISTIDRKEESWKSMIPVQLRPTHPSDRPWKAPELLLLPEWVSAGEINPHPHPRHLLLADQCTKARKNKNKKNHYDSKEEQQQKEKSWRRGGARADPWWSSNQAMT
jgi:hypothetical protein